MRLYFTSFVPGYYLFTVLGFKFWRNSTHK